MIVMLLTEHHLEFLSLKGGSRGSSESTLVKMSNCWKSHATAQFLLLIDFLGVTKLATCFPKLFEQMINFSNMKANC